MGKAPLKKQEDGELSEQEVAQRRDEVVKRMLNTPPKPHKVETKRRKRNTEGKA
ncbi:MAG: hypothetical protein ACLPPF_20625 [Rhodomicrobium sp.]